MTNRRGRAHDLIMLADQAMAVDDQGRRPPPGPLERLASHGLGVGIDREIRRVKSANHRWAQLTAERAGAAGSDRVGLSLVLACHPNGFVRQAIVDLHTNADRSRHPDRSGAGHLGRHPGVARMLANRALDPVPSIRGRPQQVLAAQFATELERQPRGWMVTSIELAAREIVGRAASIKRCPVLLDLALDLFDSSAPRFSTRGGPTHHLPGAAERHRHRQIIRHLQLDQGPGAAGRAPRVQRLIRWHDLALDETR